MAKRAKAHRSRASPGSSTRGGGNTAPEPALPSFIPSEPEGESPSGSESTPGSDKPKPPKKEEEEPEEQTLAGVVIHVNPAAGSYTLAEPGGTLDVLHAGKPPQPGTEVSVPVRLLSNGTFAEAGKRRKTGTRDRATFSGIVTYVDPTATAPAYTVSKRGASVLVHVHPDPAGTAPSLPALGAFASVAVDIEKIQLPAEPAPAPPAEAAPPPEPTPAPSAPPADPAPPPSCAPDPASPPPAIQPSAVLWQRQVSAPGAPFTSSDFAGIVSAVCPESGQLLISADDIRASGHDLLFTAGAGIDPARVEVGQSVLAMAKIGADGSLELTGLASDERTKGAEDAKSAQGELVPSKPR